jgi:hypothetical protein
LAVSNDLEEIKKDFELLEKITCLINNKDIKDQV